MDSVILNQIMINLFCNSVRRGLLSASVTAFSQTYGNLDHRHHLKVLYLRYFVILNAIALLIVGICLNIEPILILLKQDPVTAKLASMYMIYYSPSIIFESNYILLSRLIQSYKRVVPVVISGTIGIITDISGQVIILLVLKLPYYYVALSKSIPPLIMYSVLLVACAITDFKSEVGLLFNNPLNVTFTSLISEWKSYFKLAIPGVLGGILFSLTYEISSLVAGSVSNNDLAAYGIGFQINFINAFIPVCFSVAVGIRVGHFLGANDIVSAKRSMFVSIMSILCYSIPVAIVTASTASFIPRMFTQNATLIRNVRNIIFVLCIIIALKFFNLLISILFACGKQLLVFIAYIFSLFIIGLTVGLLTALLCNLGAFGLWIGHACGTVCLVITFFIFLYKIDYSKCTRLTFDSVSSEKSATETIETALLNEKPGKVVNKILPCAVIVIMVISFILGIVMRIVFTPNCLDKSVLKNYNLTQSNLISPC